MDNENKMTTQEMVEQMAMDFGCSSEHLEGMIRDSLGGEKAEISFEDYVRYVYKELETAKTTPVVKDHKIAGTVPNGIAIENLKKLQNLANRDDADKIIRIIIASARELGHDPLYIPEKLLSFQYPRYTPLQIHYIQKGLSPEKIDLIIEMRLDFDYESNNYVAYMGDDMFRFMQEHTVEEIREFFSFSTEELTNEQQRYLKTKLYTTGNRQLIDMLIERKDEWQDIEEDEEEYGLDLWRNVYANAPDRLIEEYYKTSNQ